MPIKSQKENHPQPDKPLIHLIPALAALLILMGAVLLADRYATSVENKYVHALTPLMLPQTSIGIVVQQAALRQPDLLPVYGSSEMLSDEVGRYPAYKFFAAYPTGFTVIDIAGLGNTSLDAAQTLAALGPELKGKQVVFSFTPSMFTVNAVSAKGYAANFSRLHATALAFSPHLSSTVKQHAAQRMLEYPDTLSSDPILSFALQSLAGDTLYNQIGYDLTFPLGQLDILVIRMQDHYAVWSYIQKRPDFSPAVKRQIKKIDWNTLIAQVEAQQKANASNNPYGIENKTWIDNYHQVLNISAPGSGDQDYITAVDNSQEWDDLAILLEIVKELGARPLIMGRPINGTLITAKGISAHAQQTYYTKLQSLVGAYNMPLVDFREYTNDPFFSIDAASHTSPLGWVIVDKTLNSFYHGNIP